MHVINKFADMSISSSKFEKDELKSLSSHKLEELEAEWEKGSDEISNYKINPNKRVKFINEKFTSLDECLNANFNYESMRTRPASHSRKKNSKNLPRSKDLVPIVFGKLIPGTKKEGNSKTRTNTKKVGYTDQIAKNNKRLRTPKTIKILLDWFFPSMSTNKQLIELLLLSK